MINGKHITYNIEDYGTHYRLYATVTVALDKVVERSYAIGYDEAVERRKAEEELDGKVFDLIYGDLYPHVRKIKWWVSKNCDNNMQLLDVLNLFNNMLQLLRMKND